MNVKVRFSNAMHLYHVDGTSYSFVTDISSVEHCPGVMLESGWSADGVMNGNAGATLIVNAPSSDVQYMLRLDYHDSQGGVEVQQQTSASS